MTADLAAFLLARIAEDVATARDAADRGSVWVDLRVRTSSPCEGLDPCDHLLFPLTDLEWPITPAGGEFGDDGLRHEHAAHVARHDPARVLADCEALRKVVELHWADFDECRECHADDYPCPTLLALALPWRDHPEFREEWAL